MYRRDLVRLSVLSLAATSASHVAARLAANRQFTMDLCPGRIGVRATQREAIQLAAEFGFESVEPQASELAGVDEAARNEVQDLLAKHNLKWGAAGLTVEFRQDQATFERGLAELPDVARGLSRAGVTRVGTWLRPSHTELTYLANFKQHVERLTPVAKVLGEHGLRFGLEYVGPRTSWASGRYAFIHTLAETQELIDAIGQNNMGFVLDSWHWYTAEEQVADLQSLRNEDVVAVDLNDAPRGPTVAEQMDNRRELPMATGVIDLKAFLSTLVEIGYDGPVRAEPFNQELNALDDRPAVQATANAMRSAFALVD